MNKHGNADIQSNHIIREAIKKIAFHGRVGSRTIGAAPSFLGTGQVSGYVRKINIDGPLAGTVNVQEYVSDPVSEEGGDAPYGYHEGVQLGAIQDSMGGMVIIPKLYSDVIISQNQDGTEYISMYSHVDVIQLDSHETISVGVKEREPFDVDDENSPDIHELAETGVFTNTTYKKDSIVTEVQAEQGKSEHNTKQTITGSQIKQEVGGKTDVTSDLKGHHVDHGETKLELGDNEATIQQGSSKVKVSGGKVYLGSDSGTDDAVLGGQLADILSELCGYLAQVKTTTQLGPQPFINMAQFISLKSKINSFKAAHSGFLTQKVQVQK